ncbi:MAG: Na/Pi cotransporter family protein [Alphaproteobacteria bacterium]|nr:Na/Pi cotransporter family protein [Alphaproteobacteria bacterium]
MIAKRHNIGYSAGLMELLINFAGGIALLLWGVRMVRTGITRSFGAELRRVLAASAKNRVSALFAGLAVTSALQSSTATAMIISSFAGRGMIAGAAALAIMLGADIGTTFVVQALSFDLGWLSPALIAIGVFGFLSGESSKRRSLSRTTIGLGLILLSLKLISLASAPLREAETVSIILAPLASEPVLAILIAALITWMAHSSVAIVLLIMSLAALQVLSIHLALVLVLGANFGGAIAAVTMTMRSTAATKRIPLGNLSVRLVGVLIVLPLVPFLYPYLAMLDDAPARMIANFHVVFNVFLAVLFLPLVGVVMSVLEKLIPDEDVLESDSGPKYLDPRALDTPTVALTCAAREALHMGDIVRGMLSDTMQVFNTGDEILRKQVEAQDDEVDNLHEAIKLYLTSLSREELDRTESERSLDIFSFTTNLEHIGDIIDKNLMDLAGKKSKNHSSFSDAGLGELRQFHSRILANLDLALNIFLSRDENLAKELLRQKTSIRDLELEFVERHFKRVSGGDTDTLGSSSVHLDVLRDLKRINSHLTSVVYPILEKTGQLTESRLVDDAPHTEAD